MIKSSLKKKNIFMRFYGEFFCYGRKPKKAIRSVIEDEYLSPNSNFRINLLTCKKVVLIFRKNEYLQIEIKIYIFMGMLNF